MLSSSAKEEATQKISTTPLSELSAKFVAAQKKMPNYTPAEGVGFTRSVFNIDGFFKEIKNINTMKNEDLEYLVAASYRTVFEHIVANKDKELAIFLLNNSKYISVLSSMLSKEKNIPYDVVYRINKVVYDYLNSSSVNSISEEGLLNMAMKLNQATVGKMLALKIPMGISVLISIAYHSSMNDYCKIARINKVIVDCADTKLMTEQMIVDIYVELYGSSVTILFKGVMIDSCPTNKYDEMPEACQEIYSRISLAILYIIESMSMSDIVDILDSYMGEFGYVIYGKEINPRFKLNLSADFERINTALEIIKSRSIVKH